MGELEIEAAGLEISWWEPSKQEAGTPMECNTSTFARTAQGAGQLCQWTHCTKAYIKISCEMLVTIMVASEKNGSTGDECSIQINVSSA